MSWSENRSKGDKPTLEIRKEKLRQINLVLAKLAVDEDLRDDLTLPAVQKALKHWTGEKRLPPDEAVPLTENRRVGYVLQRVQILQGVCRDASIAVPFDCFINGSRSMPDEMVVRYFGSDMLEAPLPQAPPVSSPQPTKTKLDSTKELNVKEVVNKKAAGKCEKDKVAVKEVEGTKQQPPSPVVEVNSNSYFLPISFLIIILSIFLAYYYSYHQ